MTDQQGSIPWGVIVPGFELKWKILTYGWTANCYIESWPHNIKAVKFFSNRFFNALNDESCLQRPGQVAEPQPPKPEEEIITKDVMERIKPTLRQMYAENTCPETGKLKSNCACHPNYPIFLWPESPHDIHMSFWIGKDDGNKVGRTRTALLKVLLLHNEMDVLSRLAAHPDVKKRMSGHRHLDLSLNRLAFDSIMLRALEAYICLTVLYLMQPERSPPHCLSWDSWGQVRPDYRLTKAYQMMVVDCTQKKDTWAVETYMHQEFFGVFGGVYKGEPGKPPLPGKAFGTCGLDQHLPSPYMPHETDITALINELGKLGLPVELSLMVLEHAKYEPRRRLNVPGDPFHPENEQELRQYMNNCSSLLVRVDVAKDLFGLKTDWPMEVESCIRRIFSTENMDMTIYESLRGVLSASLWREVLGVVIGTTKN